MGINFKLNLDEDDIFVKPIENKENEKKFDNFDNQPKIQDIMKACQSWDIPEDNNEVKQTINCEVLKPEKDEIKIETQINENYSNFIKEEKPKKNKNKQKKQKNKSLKSSKPSIESNINKNYKIFKIKKIIVLIFLIVFSLSIIILGIYNSFFKKDLSQNEITSMVNTQNKITAFPSDGVLGYLQQNFEDLLVDKVTFIKGTDTWSADPAKIYLNRIAFRSENQANVYFNAEIETNTGKSNYDFFVPLYYDWNTNSYHPSGDMNIRIPNIENDIEKRENDLLSFVGVPEAEASLVNDSRIFMENFLILIYNIKGNYSQQYTGDCKLHSSNLKFESISSWMLYNGTNKTGFNAQISYVVSSKEGLQYTLTSYLRIDKQESGWVIKSIL